MSSDCFGCFDFDNIICKNNCQVYCSCIRKTGLNYRTLIVKKVKEHRYNSGLMNKFQKTYYLCDLTKEKYREQLKSERLNKC